jgi:hypothetical protein
MKYIVAGFLFTFSLMCNSIEAQITQVKLAPYSGGNYAIAFFDVPVISAGTGCSPAIYKMSLAFDVSSPSGKAIYSMALMALVSNRKLLVTGAATEPCVIFNEFQLLDTISLK